MRKIYKEEEALSFPKTLRESDFRRSNGCEVARKFEEVFESTENSGVDTGNEAVVKAVVMKQIIASVKGGIYPIKEIPNLVDEGMSSDVRLGDTTETMELLKEELAACIERYCRSEHRTPYDCFPSGKYFDVQGLPYFCKPDIIFKDDARRNIELGIFKYSTSKCTKSGPKAPENDIVLQLLLDYGRSMVPDDGNEWRITAEYLWLRKNGDKDRNIRFDNFFQGNTVSMITTCYKVADDKMPDTADPDSAAEKLVEEFYAGIDKEKCSGECDNCKMFTLCHYTEISAQRDKKEIKAAGKIQLSETQEEIANCHEGINLATAAPGSGKTESISEVPIRLYQQGVSFKEMLMITFTDAGCLEMKDRVMAKAMARGINPEIVNEELRVYTFNSFAHEIADANRKLLGFDKPLNVIDTVDSKAVIAQLLDTTTVRDINYKNFKMSTKYVKGALPTTEALFTAMRKLNVDENATSAEIDAVLEESGVGSFASALTVKDLLPLYKQYKEMTAAESLITFDDQKPLAKRALELNPDYINELDCKYIIVDEFQDSDDNEMALLKMLRKYSQFKMLLCVGDPKQSIYGFRGTSPENIIHLEEKMGEPVHMIHLSENRRSLEEIVNFGNEFIKKNLNGIDDLATSTRGKGGFVQVRGFFKKDDEDPDNVENSEYYWAVKKAKELIESGQATPNDIAFIFRKRKPCYELSGLFAKEGIPANVAVNIKYMDNSRVRSALAITKAFYDPSNNQNYFDYLVSKYNGKLMDIPTAEINAEIDALRKKVSSAIYAEEESQKRTLHGLFEDLRVDEDEMYKKFLDKVYAKEDLPTEYSYLQDFMKYGDNEEVKLDCDFEGITITTAHSSKGLQWKYVFVSLDDYDKKAFNLPKNSEEMEEERRLAFVAMTRAKDFLYVIGTYENAYSTEKDRQYNRFLKECYDIAKMAFQPTDPMEALRKEIRKKENAAKAVARRAAAKSLAQVPGKLVTSLSLPDLDE